MPQKTVGLWNTGFLVPVHTRGDREFSGNGPRILIETRLFISGGRRLRARTHMLFTETKRDFTTAESTFEYDVYDGSFDNVARINNIVSPGTFSRLNFVQESGHDPFTRPENQGPVLEYVIVGDTRGSEAGTRTGAEIRFRPVTIDYEEATPGPEEIEIIPDPIEFIPPHTFGDRDFKGHGPRISCSVNVDIVNEREIQARVFMRAVETRSDWTTAEGTGHFTIYTHNRPILDIISDQFSDTELVDMDHDPDPVHLGGGELVRDFVFTGDTRGPEAGTRTGVVIHFNPIRIRG
jgi:hypothetical protein